LSPPAPRTSRIGFYTECTPGHDNSEGRASNRQGFFSDMYGAGPLRFFEVLAGWRADGGVPGEELRWGWVRYG
jgi:hypothetical protein